VGTRVEKAQRQVEKFAEAEEQWTQRASALEEDLRALEAGSGAEMLEASLSGDGQGKASEIAERTIWLRAELEASRRASVAARESREAKERAVFGARAGEMREEAKQKRSESAALKAKAAPHLRALQELEGVVYVPSSPERPASIQGLEGGAPQEIRIEIPRSDALILEAEKLEAGAARLEAKARGEDPGPPPVGVVTGELMVPAEAV
jgi:hypothetical protein